MKIINKRLPNEFVLGLIIILAVIIGGMFFIINKRNGNNSKNIITQPIACTMEAKLCPDGSSVGRTAPNCEFAACPETVNEQDTGIIYKNEKYGFQVTLPESLKGYKERVKTYKLENGSWTLTSIAFDVPVVIKDKAFSKNAIKGEDGMDYWAAFIINVNDLSSWNKNLNSAYCKKRQDILCPYTPYIIGQNDKYIFSENFPQDFPDEIKIVINDVEKNMDSIKKSFKIIDSGVTFSRDELEKAVIDAVGWKPGGENKPTIEVVHESQKAAKGKYYIKDAWPWIAFQKNDNKWNVIKIGDGVKCAEFNGILSEIPSQYIEFFRSEFYLSNGNKNCY